MRSKLLMISVALCIPLLLAGLAGCGNKSGTGDSTRPTVFIDDMGREVTLESVPERLVSIAPASTEILFALGLGDKVVGNTKYCDYPEEAKSVNKIGTFTSPNMESIVAADPDLVLATGGVQQETLAKMEELGLVVYALNPTTFAETVEDIRKIGIITGTEADAERIAADMENRAEEISRKVAEKTASGAARPKAFYEIYYENGIWTAGSGSIISNLISLAGAANVGDVEESDYYEFSLERLISENPDVYIATSGSMSDPGDISGRPGWDRMDAILNNHVFIVDEDEVYRTGPRLIDGLETLYNVFYES